MSESTTTTPSGKGKKSPKTRITKTKRAGLAFNVGKVLRLMKAGKYAPRVSPLAGIVLTATLEVNRFILFGLLCVWLLWYTTRFCIFKYMVAELLEVSGDVAKDESKKTIKPRHVMLAAKRVNCVILF